jgi:hypothetical protein
MMTQHSKNKLSALSVAKIAPNFAFKLLKDKVFGGLEALLERHLATETCNLTF